MANIAVSDAVPSRFDGDFAIATQSGATPEETAYVNRVNQILADLTNDEANDKVAGLTPARVAARKDRRKAAAQRLRKEAREYVDGSLILATAADNAPVTFGRYLADRDRLGRQLFAVTLQMADDNKDLAVDLNITLNPDLPAPEDVPSHEKQELFVQIGSAITVISTVCQQMRGRADATDIRQRADRLLDSYVRKLFGIARLGLEGQFTQLATLALNEMRNEFVAQQAGRIKNAYVRSLGGAAAVIAAPLLLWYAGIVNSTPAAGWWYEHRMFLLAAAGAAIGTWLSFSIRRVQLSFADLAILEEDLLDPSVRVIFVVGLTMIACLLFWTGVMNIEIGNLKTNAIAFSNTGSIALLIGMFCGLSERALATAISGRAAAFVKGIGGP